MTVDSWVAIRGLTAVRTIKLLRDTGAPHDVDWLSTHLPQLTSISVSKLPAATHSNIVTVIEAREQKR